MRLSPHRPASVLAFSARVGLPEEVHSCHEKSAAVDGLEGRPARGLYPWDCAGLCAAQKLAITMDDLPLNGLLPPGVTRAETTKNVLAILKKRHVPPVYGFINAKKLEGNADGAEALKLWAAAEPVGNHTYAHMDLEQNTAEAFEREIEENEPALELVARKGGPGDEWHWFRYPYLREGDTVEKRRAIRAYLQAARVQDRAGDARLGRLLMEHGLCAVRGEGRYEVD